METQYTRESQQIWDTNADAWDAHMGEGGLYQRVLIGPPTERLLALRAGEWALDIACGNGAFSRRMAKLGARVVACDFSSRFLELARGRTDPTAPIEYRQVDATDPEQLRALGSARFQAAVCTMGIMDMAALEPLAATLPELLVPDGRFVLSVMHPCFNGSGRIQVVERDDEGGKIVDAYSLKLTRYLHPGVEKGLGIVEQPQAQYYFHRPLHDLLGTFFRHGWVMDALEEPSLEGLADSAHPLGNVNWSEFPPVLIARLLRAPMAI